MTPDELAAMAGGAPLTEAAGYAVTPGFLAEFGLTASDDEDAERTCLYAAGLAGMLLCRRRLVAVAETSAEPTGEPMGAVRCASVAFAHVTALFADAPEADARVAEVGRACTGLPLDEAWEQSAHEALLLDADLMWFGPEEWKAAARLA